MKPIESEKLQKEARELNKKYNFFINLNNKSGKGIPVSIKDNICTKNLTTTAGSKILENYVPPFNATVANLKDCYIVGKTSMDEFGFGSFSTNTFQVPKNPLDPTRTCGGSSGGSAGYVKATKYSGFSITESTGGSIVNPASEIKARVSKIHSCAIRPILPLYKIL